MEQIDTTTDASKRRQNFSVFMNQNQNSNNQSDNQQIDTSTNKDNVMNQNDNINQQQNQQQKNINQFEDDNQEQQEQRRHIFLPHHFTHAYQDVKTLLVTYVSVEEPKPFAFYNLLRDIVKINGLCENYKELSFQPLQSYIQMQKPSRVKYICDDIIKFIIKSALKVETFFQNKDYIRVLRSQDVNQNVQTFTDQQCLVLISCQFLCLFPHISNQYELKNLKMPNPHTFINILTRAREPLKDNKKVKKLAFMFNYFEKELMKSLNYKPMSINVRNVDIQMSDENEEQVKIQRHMIDMEDYVHLDVEFWQQQTDQHMQKQITIEHIKRIEDHDDVTICDFANSFIGGGALGNGLAQEEILFLIFPQMHVSTLICERMADNEVIHFSNLKKYADYKGYSITLEFVDLDEVKFLRQQRKDIVALDAIKFKHKQTEAQFKIHHILRELNKAFIAFAKIEDTKYLPISTGKWGCGAFKGDPQLKFIIQWIAASAQNRPLIFNTFQDLTKIEKINEVIKILGKMNVGEAFKFLERYSESAQEFHLFDSIIKMHEADEWERLKSKRKEQLAAQAMY
eukprot:403336027